MELSVSTKHHNTYSFNSRSQEREFFYPIKILRIFAYTNNRVELILDMNWMIYSARV